MPQNKTFTKIQHKFLEMIHQCLLEVRFCRGSKLAGEYAPKNTLKVRQLKKLDKKAKQKTRIFGYTFGTVMFLLSLIGISPGIKESGSAFPDVILAGIISTVIGIISVNINYPIYIKFIGTELYGNKFLTVILYNES